MQALLKETKIENEKKRKTGDEKDQTPKMFAGANNRAKRGRKKTK